jgi:hypothetical protein
MPKYITMRKDDVTAAAGILSRAANRLYGLPDDSTTDNAAMLRRYCGYLSAYADWIIRAGYVGRNTLVCLNLAYSSGVSDIGFGRVRQQIAAEDSTVGEVTRNVSGSLFRLFIIFEIKALTNREWRSRDDVERTLAHVSRIVDDAKESAANIDAADSFRALGALHAAVTRDLLSRARPLPRMVHYHHGDMPSAALSYHLYGTADKGNELANENHVPHPLFMPWEGVAYSG